MSSPFCWDCHHRTGKPCRTKTCANHQPDAIRRANRRSQAEAQGNRGHMNAPAPTSQKVSLLNGPLDGQTAQASFVITGKQMTGPQKGEFVYGLEYLLVIKDPDDPTLKHRYVKRAGGGYYLFDGTRTQSEREETP